MKCVTVIRAWFWDEDFKTFKGPLGFLLSALGLVAALVSMNAITRTPNVDARVAESIGCLDLGVLQEHYLRQDIPFPADLRERLGVREGEQLEVVSKMPKNEVFKPPNRVHCWFEEKGQGPRLPPIWFDEECDSSSIYQFKQDGNEFDLARCARRKVERVPRYGRSDSFTAAHMALFAFKYEGTTDYPLSVERLLRREERDESIRPARPAIFSEMSLDAILDEVQNADLSPAEMRFAYEEIGRSIWYFSSIQIRNESTRSVASKNSLVVRRGDSGAVEVMGGEVDYIARGVTLNGRIDDLLPGESRVSIIRTSGAPIASEQLSLNSDLRFELDVTLLRFSLVVVLIFFGVYFWANISARRSR